MIRHTVFSSALALAGALLSSPAVQAGPDAAALYSTHCADCHAATRLGGTGPALIPQTLRRMYGPALTEVIAHGRVATQMPGFGEVLTGPEIAALAAWLETPPDHVPDWGTTEIAATRLMRDDYTPADVPVFDADPLNITLVVEIGDHHVSVLDGDTFAVLDRFATPFAVHGGPKFSPDGRYVYIMSRDGWVQAYDIWSLQEVGRVRAGLNSRNIAISKDGKWLAVANYLPMTLSILDAATLAPEKIIPVKGRHGTPSRVSAVYQAPPRDSFVLALKDIPEIWEISTAEHPPLSGAADAGRSHPRRFLLRSGLRIPDRGLARDRTGQGDRPRLRSQGGRDRPAGDAASGIGHHLGAGRRAGHGHPASPGGGDFGHRHEHLADHQADRDAGAGLFHAVARDEPPCLGRCPFRPQPRRDACDR